MNKQTIVVHDRVIWMALLSVMAAALIADQARANLHVAARATTVFHTPIDDRANVDGWCRLPSHAFDADSAILPEPGSQGSSADDSAGDTEPRAEPARNPRRSRQIDAVH